jgi:hypothetical protein
MIWRQVSAGRIEIAERGGRFRLAGERGPTQPGFAVGWICIYSDAVHQRLAPARLARAVAFLRGTSIEFRRNALIARRPEAAFAHYAEHIERRREARLRRLAQLNGDFALHRLATALAVQSQRMAQHTLRAAGRG